MRLLVGGMRNGRIDIASNQRTRPTHHSRVGLSLYARQSLKRLTSLCPEAPLPEPEGDAKCLYWLCQVALDKHWQNRD